ncbi:MAG: beta-glycosidase, partial [Bacteroidetes bacterium]
VDPETAAYNYTPEYYVLKHTSHFVLPGARKLKTGGPYDDLLSFRNSDGSVVVVAVNRSDEIKKLHLKVGDISLAPELPANSINTFKVSAL